MTDDLNPSEPLLEGMPQAEPTPEVAPPPESDILVRYRGEEIPIPQAGIDALAAAFKTTPERAVNWVQMQMDSNRAWNEAEKHKQRADTLEQQWQSHLQGQRQPQQSPYDRPGQPQYQPQAPPQYYPPQAGAQDDPIELLKLTRNEVALLRQENERRENAWEERRREEAVRQDQAQWETAADRFLAEKNKGRSRPIETRELLEEIKLSGMHMSTMAPERIFDKAFRVMTYDDAGQTAENKLMTRLREPTAKVVIPGAPSTQPSLQKPAEPNFGNLTMRDVFENMPVTKIL